MKKLRYIAAVMVTGTTLLGAFLLGADQQTPKQSARKEVVEWYYSLPKVVPNTNGRAPWVGYSGPVVRWDGTNEVWPSTLPDKYMERAIASGVTSPKRTDIETEALTRL